MTVLQSVESVGDLLSTSGVADNIPGMQQGHRDYVVCRSDIRATCIYQSKKSTPMETPCDGRNANPRQGIRANSDCELKHYHHAKAGESKNPRRRAAAPGAAGDDELRGRNRWRRSNTAITRGWWSFDSARTPTPQSATVPPRLC